MSFLDEGTFVGKGAVKDALKDPEFKALKSDEKAKALDTLKKGGSITTEIEEANAFIAAADAARDKGDKEFEFPKGSGKIHKVTIKRDIDLEEGKLSTALGGVAFLAGLLLMGKINSSDPVLQRLQAEYEQADPAQQDSIKNLMTKRILFLDTGKADASTPMKERRKGGGKGIGDALFGKSYERPFSDLLDDIDDILDKDKTTSSNDDSKLISKIASIEKGNMPEKEFNSIAKQLKKAGMGDKELKELEKRYKAARKAKENKKKPTNEGNCGCGQIPCKTYGKMKEDKQIKVDANQKFVIDLKHLMQKHGKEDTIKITKKLMKQLHNKGEVNIDGTKVLFKEMVEIDAAEMLVSALVSNYRFDMDTADNIIDNLSDHDFKIAVKMFDKGNEREALKYVLSKTTLDEQDTQLALPEPPEQTANFLGDDNMDYEGGMAKAQMLKMKNYAKALCDMIDDETQLEAWVQAKLTKASDYMSSVYHYLDYQQTKNLNEAFELNGREVVDLEAGGGGSIDPFISAAYYLDTGESLTDNEIEALINKYPADLEPGGMWWDQQR